MTGGNVLSRHNVRIAGQGPRTLVFAHGYGCDQSVWGAIVPAFAADHTTVVFDHVGAGDSPPGAYNPHRHSSLTGYARDVIELVEALDRGPVTLIGHSVSAMIGALAAIERPDLFDHLVMVGPSACYFNDGAYQGGFERDELEEFLLLLENNFEGWAEALSVLAMGNRATPELADGLRNRICRSDPMIAGAFARLTFLSDLRPALPRLRVATTVLQCADDPIAPLSAGSYVHAAVPDAAMVVLDTSGHCPHMSHPDILIKALADRL